MSCIRIVIAAMFCVLLGGCVGSKPAADVYMLRASSGDAKQERPTRGTLKIVLPVASPGLDSSKIAVLEQSGQLSFIEGSEWSDTVPKILQNALVESFEDTGKFRSVVPDSQGVSADYSLLTDVRKFYVTRDASSSRVEVRMVARLTDPLTRKVRFSITSRQHVSVEDNSLASTLEAFTRATDAALQEIVEKTLKQI